MDDGSARECVRKHQPQPSIRQLWRSSRAEFKDGGRIRLNTGLLPFALASSMDGEELPSSIAFKKDKHGYDRQVGIACTPYAFGSVRPWWVCPICENRSALLYEINSQVRCRRCHESA